MITGASRGIGLELVRQYAADGWKVIATCRTPIGVGELARIEGDIEVHGLDVNNTHQLDRLAKDLDGAAIDVLINSAGILGPRGVPYDEIDNMEWMKVMETNVYSPLKVCAAFVPHVLRSEQKKMVTVSSIMGSIESNTSGGMYIYRSSKSAVNSVMRSLAYDLKEQGISVRVLHPGWVKTDMGGESADIDVVQSVSGIRSVIDGLSLSTTGQFYNYDGSELPW